MIYSCASHIGKVRTNNEDYCGGEIIEIEEKNTVGVFAIADGMGGHKKGEVASKLAVENIICFLKENLIQHENVKIDYIDDILKQAYNSVNSIIHKKSVDNIECEGMGTTLVTAVIYKNNLYVANVGDSRCYLSHGKKFDKITVDHSIVEELVRANVITEREAKTHPRRNHITRAMGTDEMVIVDIFKCSIEPEDMILLATDGLTGFVEDDEVKKIISKDKNIDEISEELINMANEVSGKDNVSVILIKA
ncbi:Stp1/IreP family PP2C-type Ser/Thr phosphatase [Romboutsia weinsteinii]|uniref:Stp1/IreP family PP2C-type Ser/Thr phosphatase n=1 Tax=Romboutsia weinsteinii TaxID=2020949 RepID=A0A371J7G4_9FIRM|nr:Stp1/IreP family PP2C-type Ser/Thr phosphatase [Romboutsia weinsteinii]RDY28675.1 Stp1/IreP family PP2C-type Ser/Thr phosphatase [Romboutsia weinsteinii]